MKILEAAFMTRILNVLGSKPSNLCRLRGKKSFKGYNSLIWAKSYFIVLFWDDLKSLYFWVHLKHG